MYPCQFIQNHHNIVKRDIKSCMSNFVSGPDLEFYTVIGSPDLLNREKILISLLQYKSTNYPSQLHSNNK